MFRIRTGFPFTSTQQTTFQTVSSISGYLIFRGAAARKRFKAFPRPDRSRIFIIASANANCKGECIFLPYEISKPFRTQKSLYYRQKRLSAVLKTEPFRADLPVNGPAAPAARRFLPARASEKTGGCSTALGFAQRLRKNGSARRRSLATEGRIHKASFSGRVSLFPCERT